MSMPLDPSLEPPAGAASGDGPDDGPAGSRGWWRAPLAAVAIAVPLLAGAAGVRLGCDVGALDLALCASGDAPVAAVEAAVEVSGDQATLTVTDAAGAPVAVAQEPADRLVSQFTKFAVAAPDASRVLYVTAADLGMRDAALWVVPRGGRKALLKQFGDEFWVARPVWCQARPGHPGQIAYVARGPAGGELTGLELWVIGGDGAGDRRVLVGTRANGFGPDLFYGDRATPLHFMAGCERLRYIDGDGAERRVVDLETGEVREPMAAPLLPTAAPPAVPRPAAPAVPTTGNPVTQSCYLKPFAQTDPRWGGDLMRTANSAIRSWGCALTSTAMVFHYYGLDTDPGRLNQCAGPYADELHWEPVRQRCAAGTIPAAARWSRHADLGRPGARRGRRPAGDRRAAGRAGRLTLPGRHRRPGQSGRQLSHHRQLGRVNLQDAGRLHQSEEGLPPQVAGRLRGSAAALHAGRPARAVGRARQLPESAGRRRL